MDETTEQAELPTVTASAGKDMLTSTTAFEHVQRVAKVFAASKLVPEAYRNNIADCIIALQMANRMEIDPLMFMQNTYVVHGRPALEGKFAVALVNKYGPYPHGVSFEVNGDGADLSVTAIGVRRTGKEDRCTVTYAQARANGWVDKNPLWKNNPEQMLHYRAGAWLARRYCPEVLMGLQTVEEVEDVVDVTPVSGAAKLTSKLKGETK